MPGLDPGIHFFTYACAKGVDRRVKPGDDVSGDLETNRWGRNTSAWEADDWGGEDDAAMDDANH